MLEHNLERILEMLDDDALVLDVGGWAAPFRRADWVLDLMPHQTRGALGAYGPGPERFRAQSWVVRDMCARDPWPWPDDHFDFAVCLTTLEDVRDPIWVCQEMSRVARAGYVEVPTVIAELAYDVQGRGPWLGHDHHRWLCRADPAAQAIEFMHKPHSVHHDWRLRVLPRWVAEMTPEDHLQAVFWEGGLEARERFFIDRPFPLDELAAEVRARFRPSPWELRLKAGREAARRLAARATAPLRGAAERALERARR